MDPYEHLKWSEHAPGVWQRDIDEAEQFYTNLAKLYEGSGRMFFAITGHLSLLINLTAGEDRDAAEKRVDDALRKAWLALRFHHPTIGAQVIYDETKGRFQKVYRTFKNEEDQETWVDATFQLVPERQTGVDWANSDPPAPKLPTLFVLNPTSPHDTEAMISRDLVFRSPHDIIDGIGTLHLLSNLLAQAARIHELGDAYPVPSLDGSETENLSPSFRIAAKVPTELTEAQKERLSAIANEKEAVSRDVEILGIPFNEGAQLPGKHQRVAITLSPETTVQLLQGCKSLGVTVTHAFHAAIAMVVRDLQPLRSEPSRGRYVNYLLRNERQSCVEPFNTPKHAAAVYHSISGKSLVVDLDLPTIDGRGEPKEEFLQIVHHMKQFYEDVRDDPEHYALACPIWAASTPQLPKSKGQVAVPPPKALPSVSISSMGRIDSILGHHDGLFQAFNPWVTGEELGNGLGLFLGTFRGELCLSGAYNDARHDKEEVLDFLCRCKKIVGEGLGLFMD